MSEMAPPLTFSVRRHEPELVAPAKPTPRELKPLSDMEDQEGLHFDVPVIMFYRADPSMGGKDPVKVIREALAAALVFYYPLAGKLIRGTNRRLMVDCTAEGVLFIEADADIRLEELGDAIMPPCPKLEELIYMVPGSDGILGCPLRSFQVTHLSCRGFIVSLLFSHTTCDGASIAQFLKAVGEIAREAHAPSLLPVWERETTFAARRPPRVTCSHHEYALELVKKVRAQVNEEYVRSLTDGTVASIALPKEAMKRFHQELKTMTRGEPREAPSINA